MQTNDIDKEQQFQSDPTQPDGFSKGVNDYLNHYITISDAKAVAFLALNFVVIQFLMKDYFSMCWGFNLHFGALCFLVLSIIMAAFVLFPRLPRGSKGLIFWEDIRERKSPQEYENEINKLTSCKIEKEYSHQNYYVSNVLHKKMRLIQWEIGLFLAGIFFTILSVIGKNH